MSKLIEALEKRQGHGISDEDSESYSLGYSDAVRDVIAMFQTLEPWQRNISGSFTGGEAASIVEREFNAR